MRRPDYTLVGLFFSLEGDSPRFVVEEKKFNKSGTFFRIFPIKWGLTACKTGYFQIIEIIHFLCEECYFLLVKAFAGLFFWGAFYGLLGP